MASDKLATALQLHQAGRLAEAERLYREILHADSRQADAWHLLGMLAHQNGDHSTGICLIERAIALSGECPDYHSNLATVHFAVGDYPSAEAACRRAIQLRPDFSQAHNNLGNSLLLQGRATEALLCYQEAVRLNPGYAKAWSHAASACRILRRLDEAVANWRRALEIAPASLEVVNHLGSTLQEMGYWEEALSLYEQAQAFHPESAEIQIRLAVALRQLGQRHRSAECFRQALRHKPRDARAHNDLGELLWRNGDAAGAMACFQRAMEIMPDLAAAHFNLANAFRETGRLDEAETGYHTALALDPHSVGPLTNLGITLCDQGRTSEAREIFEQVHALSPDDPRAHSHVLVVEQYLPGATPQSLRSHHEAWNRQHAQVLATPARFIRRSSEADRPLRLGFVSRDFRQHPVGLFFLSAIQSLDHQRFQLTGYADQVASDRITDRIRQSCSAWRHVAGLTDEQLSELIRSDQIDILVDLAGHTAGHRLLVFARKPAPVQVTWMGYVGTTGLPAIDYLLSDRFHTPDGVDPYYVEEIVRLPGDYICFLPPDDAPPVAELPVLKSGRITFASFNNPAKLSAATIAVWAEVLRRLPASRLLLKYHGLDCRGAQTHIVNQFVAQGIHDGRIELEGPSDQRGLLDRYHAVDVALDTYPYSGGLTTCEALWMGVPVVTCPGPTFASRHAFSHLSNAGLTETVAQSAQHYVDVAVHLATDTRGLHELRTGLRSRLAASPLCDPVAYARGLEAALLKMGHRVRETHG